MQQKHPKKYFVKQKLLPCIHLPPSSSASLTLLPIVSPCFSSNHLWISSKQNRCVKIYGYMFQNNIHQLLCFKMFHLLSIRQTSLRLHLLWINPTSRYTGYTMYVLHKGQVSIPEAGIMCQKLTELVYQLTNAQTVSLTLQWWGTPVQGSNQFCFDMSTEIRGVFLQSKY